MCPLTNRRHSNYLILFTPCTACTVRIVEPLALEYVVILNGYHIVRTNVRRIWEQGLGGSNPLASTILSALHFSRVFADLYLPFQGGAPLRFISKVAVAIICGAGTYFFGAPLVPLFFGLVVAIEAILTIEKTFYCYNMLK